MSEQLSMDAGWNERGIDTGHSRRFKFPWTDENIERLKAMLCEGLSCSKIGATLGCSGNAVIGKVHRLGWSVPKKPPGPKPRHAKLYPDREYKPIRRKRKPPMIFDNYQPQAGDVVPLNLTFAELGRGQCKFPYGDGPFFFCGHPVAGELPYCGGHAILCYTTSSGERPHSRYNFLKSRILAKDMVQYVEPVDPDEMGTAA